jgi:hypothetical protein
VPTRARASPDTGRRESADRERPRLRPPEVGRGEGSAPRVKIVCKDIRGVRGLARRASLRAPSVAWNHAAPSGLRAEHDRESSRCAFARTDYRIRPALCPSEALQGRAPGRGRHCREPRRIRRSGFGPRLRPGMTGRAGRLGGARRVASLSTAQPGGPDRSAAGWRVTVAGGGRVPTPVRDARRRPNWRRCVLDACRPLHPCLRVTAVREVSRGRDRQSTGRMWFRTPDWPLSALPPTTKPAYLAGTFMRTRQAWVAGVPHEPPSGPQRRPAGAPAPRAGLAARSPRASGAARVAVGAVFPRSHRVGRRRVGTGAQPPCVPIS